MPPASAGRRRSSCAIGAGDWNALHQDRYGAVAFPLQVLIVLSERGRDYEGGEVVLVEQRPRAQSRATTIAVAARRGHRLHQSRTTRARHARRPSGRDAPRGEHADARRALHPRHHLPRRRVVRRDADAALPLLGADGAALVARRAQRVPEAAGHRADAADPEAADRARRRRGRSARARAPRAPRSARSRPRS